jgi:DNA-directed RNA polymerase beta' subunit
MEKYDQKADSLLKMQEKYRELIQESNQRIEELSEQRQTIIEKQPQIFNRYVTKYITNNSPADTSTFNQVYERSVHEFDSLWQSGFFVTK